MTTYWWCPSAPTADDNDEQRTGAAYERDPLASMEPSPSPQRGRSQCWRQLRWWHLVWRLLAHPMPSPLPSPAAPLVITQASRAGNLRAALHGDQSRLSLCEALTT